MAPRCAQRVGLGCCPGALERRLAPIGCIELNIRAIKPVADEISSGDPECADEASARRGEQSARATVPGQSGLQEVVGQPGMTLEQAKQEEFKVQAQLREQEVSSASTRPSPGANVSGSSSSSGATTKVNKHLDKNRTLVRRHSDGDSARN